MQLDNLRVNLRSVEEAVTAANAIRELAEMAGTPIVVMAHRNADPDALASALVLRDLLQSEGFDARLVLPEGLSQPSKRIVKRILEVDSIDVEDEWPSESAMAIVADTASPSQLGKLADFALQVLLVVVDHHSSNELIERAIVSVYDPSARATAELVYILARHGFKKTLTKEQLELLLAGIVYDSRHFLLSNARTLRLAAEILESGASLERVLSALQSPPMEIPERIARLKAAKRMHVIRADEFLISITHVGAYESSVARGLLDLGADIVIVVSERGTETRVIGRAKKHVLDKLGLHLGRDIMENVAQRLGGSGGGHAQAAGATVSATAERALSVVIEIINEFFKDKKLNPQPIS